MLKTCAVVVHFLLSRGHRKFFFATLRANRVAHSVAKTPSYFASLVLLLTARRISAAPRHQFTSFVGLSCVIASKESLLVDPW